MQSNKAYFREPEFKYVQANKPNEMIHMDLTDIPKEILENIKDNRFTKIECIVDNLTKYAYAELISSKQAKEVLPVLMRYVNMKGCPNILLTDNGKEFINPLSSSWEEAHIIASHNLTAGAL